MYEFVKTESPTEPGVGEVPHEISEETAEAAAGVPPRGPGAGLEPREAR